ncbi:MAG: hypothetical protein WAV38_36975, partial [Xanthobacteraceae bacterium]
MTMVVLFAIFFSCLAGRSIRNDLTLTFPMLIEQVDPGKTTTYRSFNSARADRQKSNDKSGSESLKLRTHRILPYPARAAYVQNFSSLALS